MADSDVAHLNLGLELQRRNQRSAALTEYAIAWRMNPKSVLVNANIAGILAEENKPEKAAVYYDLVIKENNWLPYAFQNYGRVLVTLKRYDEAMKQFSAAAKIDPTKALPHVLMGKLWLQQGRDAEAVKELLTALKLEPGNLDVMILAASLLAASEDPSVRDKTQAYALASEAVKLTDHRSPAALDVLAMSYAEQGKFDDAIQTQQQAIKLANENNNMKDDIELLQKRLESYQKHQPWRESSKAPE
ncbi:MAG TPA: tetratricopeptide repeat protein [Verrucomicrobiae bacterium]